ncbi:unnamed protein product, partial [Echinostoma caproni]|uniref:FAD synthase n=1 Tax=Echinostoma caproni TaxID=27848 RepID=A0A183B4B0_9TREM
YKTLKTPRNLEKKSLCTSFPVQTVSKIAPSLTQQQKLNFSILLTNTNFRSNLYRLLHCLTMQSFSGLFLVTIPYCFHFSLDQIVIGFNGGKDCTALLHLVYAVLQKRCPSRTTVSLPRLFASATGSSNFDHSAGLIVFEGPIKSSLVRLNKAFPHIRAVFMGTRITDPRAGKLHFIHLYHLTPMVMTDPDWPQLMRVNPLLHWTYSDVWKFLRSLSLPYCNLYDVGYTSLGSMEDTHPNPSLRYVTESGLTEYRPAYLLSDFHLERSGRRKPEAKPTISESESKTKRS